MKKVIVLIFSLLFIFIIGAGSILFFRSCDYRAVFTVKTTPDVVYFNIINWDIWNRKNKGVNFITEFKQPVQAITTKVELKDTTLVFIWKLERLNDSLTNVTVCVSDPVRKLKNRLITPFFSTAFKKSIQQNIYDLQKRMNLMLKTFSFQFSGVSHFKEKTCVYTVFKSTVRGKARAMIGNVVMLNQFVKKQELELDGPPFIVINNWNEYKDTLEFEFCFPITSVERIINHPEIRIKKIDGMDAVKTDFYGNYSITDISWYNLSTGAKKLGYVKNNKLIEVYYNDPHGGTDDQEWKAEIYLGSIADN